MNDWVGLVLVVVAVIVLFRLAIKPEVVAENKKRTPAFHRHRWCTAENTLIHQYQVCLRCGSRRIIRTSRASLIQPVDRQWVRTGRWAELRPPRPNRPPHARKIDKRA